jgi:hypothetical protein
MNGFILQIPQNQGWLGGTFYNGLINLFLTFIAQFSSQNPKYLALVCVLYLLQAGGIPNQNIYTCIYGGKSRFIFGEP